MLMALKRARLIEHPPWRFVAACLLGWCSWWSGADAASASRARAQWTGPGTELLAQQDGRISEDGAAAIVREETGGRILGVRARTRGGRLTYEVKVLRDGRVSIYKVDGATGQIRR